MDWGRVNRRVPLPCCHGRRGLGPSLSLRSPFDGVPAKRSADGRAAEPLHEWEDGRQRATAVSRVRKRALRRLQERTESMLKMFG